MTAFVRALLPEDDRTAINGVVRAAYARHAADGISFWSAPPSVEDTARRLASGQGLVAIADDRIVGTITLRGSRPDSPIVTYRTPGTWSFVQFAVDPPYQGRGIGSALHAHALERAAAGGGRLMVIATAAKATALITMYQKWGYRMCGLIDWRPNRDEFGVLLSRELTCFCGRDNTSGSTLTGLGVV